MANRPDILFLCPDGLARCLMAEGFTRYLGGSSVSVTTAGQIGAAVHPYCQWAMNEAGVDISSISVRRLEDLDLSSFSHIVTLSKKSGEVGSKASGRAKVQRWDLPDPEAIRGNPSDRIKAFRAVRNEIEARVRALLSEALEKN